MVLGMNVDPHPRCKILTQLLPMIWSNCWSMGQILLKKALNEWLLMFDFICV